VVLENCLSTGEEETGLTRYEQEGARKTLRSLDSGKRRSEAYPPAYGSASTWTSWSEG
jgi:hypothetical protein